MDPGSIRSSILAFWHVGERHGCQHSTTDAKERLVKRAAAVYLADRRGYRASSSQVGQAVLRNVGSLQTLGIRKSLRHLLADDPGFTVVNLQATEADIMLNVQHIAQSRPAVTNQLQQQACVRVVPRPQPFGRVQPPQQQTAVPNKNDCRSSTCTPAATTAGPCSILAIISALWHTNAQGDSQQLTSEAKERLVKRAAATYLAGQAGYASTSSDLSQHVDQTLGRTTRLGIVKKFRQLLADDPCFVVNDLHMPEAVIALNVQHLMQHRPAAAEAVQQRHQQAQLPPSPQFPQQRQLLQQGRQGIPPSPPPRGLVADRCTPQQQRQRLLPPVVAINTLYSLSGTPEDQLKHVAAKHLLNCSRTTASAACLTEVLQHDLGLTISPAYLLQLLSTDSTFKVVETTNHLLPGSAAVSLDVALLRQRAAAAHSPNRQQPAATSGSDISSSKRGQTSITDSLDFQQKQPAASPAAAAAAAPKPATTTGAASAPDARQLTLALVAEASSATRVPPEPLSSLHRTAQASTNAGQAHVQTEQLDLRQQRALAPQQPTAGWDQSESSTAPAAAGEGAPSSGAPADAYLSEALQLLGGLSLDDCRSAEVLDLMELQRPLNLTARQTTQQLGRVVDKVLYHTTLAKLAAWDFSVGNQCTAKPKRSPPVAAGHAGLTEVRVFVPATDGWPGVVYVLPPTDKVMRQLQPVLSGRNVLNVFHDVRHTSLVLMQQYSINMRRPLDTQLLAGITGLAAAASGAQSSSSSCSIDANRGSSRQSFEQLLSAYGLPAQPEQDRVRFLPLLAQQLMMQLPASLLAVGDLQVVLAGHQQQQQSTGVGSSSLSLQPHMIPGYSPLIMQQADDEACNMALEPTAAATSGVHVTNSGNLELVSMGGSTPSPAVTSYLLGDKGDQGLTQLCFELRLQHQAAGGWFRCSYEMHLVDDQHAGAVSSSPRSVEPGPGCQQLALLAPAAAAGQEGSSTDAESDVDEAVQSMISLLPHRLQPYLQPYVSKQEQPALMEVLIDTNDVVKLRLADKTMEALDVSLDIVEVLEHLAAAQHVPKQLLHPHSKADSVAGRYPACITNHSSSSLVQYTGSCSKLCGEAVARAAPSEEQDTASNKGFFGLFGGRKDLSTGSTELRGFKPTDFAVNPAVSVSSYVSDSESVSRCSCTDTSKLAAVCGFGSDNRIGVAGTLHRISAIRDKQGSGVVGLTFRIGRDVWGVARPLADVLSSCKASVDAASGADRPRCVLLLGRRGVGKTTLLRNVSYLLSMPAAQGGLGMSVVVVDTSNEIAGDCEERHPCIGSARRMMVRRREDQADVLIEAVQNHTPDVIIVDEIGTKKEVDAARTIAQRGVVLIATAHGNTLGDLLRNPTLRELVGGVTAVTLGDHVAKGGNKTRFQRAGEATFNTLVELRAKHEWCLHLDVDRSVDAMLGAGFLDITGNASDCGNSQMQMSGSKAAITQTRTVDSAGHVMVSFGSPAAAKQALHLGKVVDQLADRAQQRARSGGSSRLGHQASQSDDAATEGRQARLTGHAFTGGWLIDLVHAAVHRSVDSTAG